MNIAVFHARRRCSARAAASTLFRAVVVSAAALAGVAVSAPAPVEAAVFDTAVRWPTRSDGATIVPVCVIDGSSAEQRDGGAIHELNPSLGDVVGRVRDALRRSWEASSSVRFVGWQHCSQLSDAAKAQAIGLYIHPDTDNNSYIGTWTRGRTSRDDAATSFKPWGNGAQCIEYDAGRALMEYRFSCVEQYAIHEFGHAIGFLHEWQHPLTPGDCSTTRSVDEQPVGATDTRYDIVNPGTYDWDSIMTYDDACAHVTGERFGSENLDSTDRAGVAAAYPPVTPRPFDVGVIPDAAGSCPDATEVKIATDNEDSDNNNQRSGWIGAIASGRNTTFEFCKVDGTLLDNLGAPSTGSANYAVLKLGQSCPNGSTEFVRYQDDQDEPPLNVSWMAGETGPNRQNFDGGTGTELHWCLFVQSATAQMHRFPDLGFDYGVVAAANFSQARATGYVRTDDEDDDNQNRLAAGGAKAVIDTMMETGANTKTWLALVEVNDPPTVSAVLHGASPTEGTALSFSAVGADPNGDSLTYSWDFGDGGSTGSGPTPSHTFADNGVYDVTVTATDPSGLEGSATLSVEVDNVAPSVSATSATIDENGEATISITIDDPGTSDTFDVEIVGIDGGVTVTRPASSIGTQTFDVPRRFLDDHPHGTPTDTSELTVTVTDDDAGVGTTTSTVTVDNVAPRVAATGATIDEDGEVTISVTVDDPGTEDTFDVDVVWGDGATDTFTRPASPTGTQTFHRTHRYLDDDPSGTPTDHYPAVVTVVDDDTGRGTAVGTVTVHNVVPTASIDAVLQGGLLIGDVAPATTDVVLAGLPVDLGATFADVGTRDTHHVSVAWGDGHVDEGAATDPIRATHTYDTLGDHTLTMTVADDDTAIATVSLVLHVVDPAGAVIDTINDLAAVAGDPATDPAAADLIGEALDQLDGNQSGAAGNGALDKLEHGAWNAALLKLAAAVTVLQQADPLVDADLSVVVTQLVHAAKVIAVDLITEATASATRPAEVDRVAEARVHLADGDARWALGDASGAIEQYRHALTGLRR